MVLFKLSFKPSEERKRVAGSAGKSRQNLVVVKTAHLFRAGLHHGFAHGHLTIAGHRHVSITPHQQDRRAAHFWKLFLAHQ